MRHEVDEDFVRYVRARQHQLLRAAYLVSGDVRLAEELVRGALARLARHWERVREEDPDLLVRRLLYRDAVASERRGRRDRLGSISVELVASAVAPAAGERVDTVSALLTLTPRQRAVVVLLWFEHRSEPETADVLGMSVGTVRNQARAAVDRMRTLLPDLAPTPARGDDR
jgi:DNA-directed RNA polymerase specialized sigma24 family protein